MKWRMNITYKSGDYVSVPMTESLFWSRVGWLRNAMLTAENFEFRLLYFNKLQELMRFVP
jgi:hypothetical protein